MKTIDNAKRKLKTRKWLNKHNGSVVLAIMTPLAILNAIFFFINPIIAVSFLVACLGVGVVGGIEVLFKEDKNKEKEVELTKDLDALTGASKETVVEIQKEIEQTKERRLLKTLIKRKKLVEKSLKEKELAYVNGVNTAEIGLE